MAKMSNAEWTRDLVMKNKNAEPHTLVDKIVKHTGMQKSGARTYLANARKAIEAGKTAKKVAAKKRKRAPAKKKAATSAPAASTEA